MKELEEAIRVLGDKLNDKDLQVDLDSALDIAHDMDILKEAKRILKTYKDK